MPANTRVSLIGAGRIAFQLEMDPLRNKPCTHMGAVNFLICQKKKISWEAVCDLKPGNLDSAAKYLKSCNISETPEMYSDYNKVILKKPDVLIISANTPVHYEITMKAIKARISRIVLEKPVVLNAKEAKKLFKTAESNGTHIWVNYERRYHLKYQEIKSIISKQKYGKVLTYKGWFASPHKDFFPGGKESEGVLLHDTTHLVDLIQFLFGNPVKFNRPDNGFEKYSQAQFLHLKHEDDITGEILTTICSDFFHLELDIIFETARIVVGNGFFRIEKSQKSRLYKNFISLSERKNLKEPKSAFKFSPFVKLYEDVFNDNYYSDYFKQACDNIAFLT